MTPGVAHLVENPILHTHDRPRHERKQSQRTGNRVFSYASRRYDLRRVQIQKPPNASLLQLGVDSYFYRRTPDEAMERVRSRLSLSGRI